MKLLDEKGLETVWSTCKVKFALAGHTHNYAGSESAGGPANSAIGVVDYGQADKNIQIGYAGEGITGDQIKYIAGYTDGGGNVSAKIKNVSKDDLKAWLGIREDGGRYTLPVASATTLGGIKVSENANGTGWPICVDGNGLAETKIKGLIKDDIALSSVMLNSGDNTTYYNCNSINIENKTGKLRADVSLPIKSGVLALTSDIPDTSNLCSINSISNASECKKGYINIYSTISGTFSADGLEIGAVLFFRVYSECDVTYRGGIRFDTNFFSGTVKLKAGMCLLYMEDDLLIITSFK